MKKLSFFILIIFFVSYFSPRFIYSQNKTDNDEPIPNPSFQVTVNNFNSSIDTINIFISSTEIEISPKFHIELYRIRDIESYMANRIRSNVFYLDYTDTANLSGFCDKEKTFETIPKTVPQKQNGKIKYVVATNVALNPLSKGAYIIRINYRSKVAFAGFLVADISLITKVAANMVLCQTVNKFTGEPISNIRATCYLDSIDNFSMLTDKDGLASFQLTDSNRAAIKRGRIQYPFVIVNSDSEIAVTNPENFFRFVSDSYKGYIYTNQPVYQPLSKVEFKGTIRKYTEKEIENVESQEVFVKIADPKNSRVYFKVLKTNSNGTFSGDFTLGDGFPLGVYKITAGLNDGITFNSDFQVDEFRKPEYFVNMSFDKPQYTNGDVVTGTINAGYYFGSPVSGADVEYRIFKKPYHKQWWQFSPYKWFFQEYYENEKENRKFRNSQYVVKGSGKLDENGQFEFLYSVNEDFTEKYGNDPRNSYKTDYVYIIEAIVTDKSRIGVSKTSTTFITRSEYYIAVATDKYVYESGEKIGIKVNAADFSDKPAQAPLNVTVTRKTWNRASNKENVEFVSTLSGKTLADGSAIIFFDANKEGRYEFEVTSFDENGSKVSESTNCYVSSGNMNWWSSDNSNTIQLLPDKPFYNSGEQCKTWVISPIPDATMLITISSENILLYRTEKLEGTSGYIEFPVQESYGPNCFLEVSFVKNGILYSSNKSILVLAASRFLNLDLSTDKKIYKPRDEGIITAHITDNSGNPVKNAELCIGVVDESIYAISEDHTKDIRNFFYPVSSNTVESRIIGPYAFPHGSRYASIRDRYDVDQLRETDAGTVSGRITDEEGNPLSFAIVVINNEFVADRTNSLGGFLIRLPGGTYDLTVINNEVPLNGRYSLYISNGKSVFLNLKTDENKLKSGRIITYKENVEQETRSVFNEKYGMIKGRVFDKKDKSPLVGAILWIEGANIRVATDEGGNYRFSKLPIGVYSVKCTYVGYESAVMRNVEIMQGKTVTADFGMITGGAITDMLEIETQKRSVPTETSGKIIEEEPNEDQLNKATNFVEPELRKNFSDEIHWEPSVFTDENGNAKVTVKFPDNLTTWRITAKVITADTKVGQNTDKVISRKDLIVRLEAPRFLQQKDEVTVSAIVHNYLDEDKLTKITIKTDNLVPLPGVDSSQTIIIQNNEIKRIDWGFKVALPNGLSTLTATALTDKESDAVQFKLNQQPFGLPVSSTNGLSFTGGNETRSMSFEIPDKVDIGSSKIKISLSPSITSSVLNSLDELIGYPYGCIEQTMSRFVPSAIVASALKKVNAPLDDYMQYELPKVIDKGLEKIYSMQRPNGSWGWWENGQPDVYMTSYVIYSLALAGNSGYAVRPEVKKKGCEFLRNSLADEEMESTSRAFVLLALSEADTLRSDFFAKQFRFMNNFELNDFANSLLSLTASRVGNNKTAEKYNDILLKNLKRDGDSKIYWGGKILRYSWQEDNIMTTAMVIKALLSGVKSRPDYKPYIDKAARWLISTRNTAGRNNTVQNAFIAFGLSDYLVYDNLLNPDYNIKIYVNNNQVAQAQITHDDIFKKAQVIEIGSEFLKSGANEIRIEKIGNGSLDVNSGLTYYSSEENRDSKIDGFEVERSYYKLESFRDVKENKMILLKSPLAGPLKPGEEILVKVAVTPSRDKEEYFMLEDPIPAGCMVVKDDWGYTIEGENDYKGSNYYYWRWWYSNREIRSNKISFFGNMYGAEKREFSYILRAQIPGTYYVNPAVACLMYYPEVKGSSHENKVTIIDK